jgi:hypothetical protein
MLSRQVRVTRQRLPLGLLKAFQILEMLIYFDHGRDPVADLCLARKIRRSRRDLGLG